MRNKKFNSSSASKSTFLKFDQKTFCWVSIPCNSENQKTNHSQIIGHQTFNFSYTFTVMFAVLAPQSRWHQEIVKRSLVML